MLYFILLKEKHMTRQKYKALRRFIKQFIPVDETGRIKPYNNEYVAENMQKFCDDAIEMLKKERFV